MKLLQGSKIDLGSGSPVELPEPISSGKIKATSINAACCAENRTLRFMSVLKRVPKVRATNCKVRRGGDVSGREVRAAAIRLLVQGLRICGLSRLPTSHAFRHHRRSLSPFPSPSRRFRHGSRRPCNLREDLRPPRRPSQRTY
jgi:hypothetical protein